MHTYKFKIPGVDISEKAADCFIICPILDVYLNTNNYHMHDAL